MTREERAKKVLINLQSQFQASLDGVDVDEDCKEAEEDNTEIVNALEMAIKALEQEPCDTCGYEEGSIYCKEHCPHEAKIEQEPCEDAISREATLKPYNDLNDEDTISVWLIRKNIEQQPSVNPTKTGHWISHHHGCEYECSECHDKQRTKSNYCPNCGAKMKGDTDRFRK